MRYKSKVGEKAFLVSYIDDFSITTVSKSARQNCLILKREAESLVREAKKSAIEFDISKTELIHFSGRKVDQIPIKLEGFQTEITPKKVVKWLGIYLDSKLSFKEHIKKKVVVVEKAFYRVKRLGNC